MAACGDGTAGTRPPAAPRGGARRGRGASLPLAAAAALLLVGCGAADRLRLATSSNPVPPSALSVARGEGLYERHCLSCHGAAADGRGPLAERLGMPPANLRANRAPAGVVAMRITHGVGEHMPPWGGVLDAESVWDLVNYLETRRRSDPDARERWWN